MISFTLRCSNGHEFDGWFAGSSAYETQKEKGLLSCPVCGDQTVEKALMAPRVSTARAKERAAEDLRSSLAQAKVAMEAEGKPAPVEGEVLPVETPQPVAAVPSLKDAPEPVKAYVDAVRKLRSEVEANSEDVGDRFAEEARKMHNGETEERAIRGQASLKDAVELDEEGIDLFVLPTLPEDAH